MDRLVAIGAAAGALLTILGLTALLGRRMWKAWQRLDAFLSDWFGEPARPGRARVPSMPERVAQLEQRVGNVENQVTPNGGNTNRLGDRIVRVERALTNEATED